MTAKYMLQGHSGVISIIQLRTLFQVRVLGILFLQNMILKEMFSGVLILGLEV